MVVSFSYKVPLASSPEDLEAERGAERKRRDMAVKVGDRCHRPKASFGGCLTGRACASRVYIDLSYFMLLLKQSAQSTYLPIHYL